ncbi:MAG: hypothetical protein KKB67_09550, partial [Alphaproteobacteria bacterium]|nr:hypothetical protein [Alphaproteobacteria bacterium]
MKSTACASSSDPLSYAALAEENALLREQLQRTFAPNWPPTVAVLEIREDHVRSHLPADTVLVTPDARAEAIRERTLRAHTRIIW